MYSRSFIASPFCDYGPDYTAHDDHKPSLSINQGTDGRALVHCHAGCSVEAICEALGLTLRDLMPDTNPLSVLTQPRVASSNRGSVNVSNSYPTAEEAIVKWEKQFGKRAAVWTYTDAGGQPVPEAPKHTGGTLDEFVAAGHSPHCTNMWPKAVLWDSVGVCRVLHRQMLGPHCSGSMPLGPGAGGRSGTRSSETGQASSGI